MTAVRTLGLADGGLDTIAAAASATPADGAVTATPDAFLAWTAAARWWRLQRPGGDHVRLWVRWPHAVLETVLGSQRTLLLGPASSGPALFFATVQVATMAPMTLDTVTVLHAGPAARGWLDDGRAPDDGDLLRWDHGRAGAVVDQAVWARVGSGWCSVTTGTVTPAPAPEPADTAADTDDTDVPAVRYRPLSLGLLLPELSLALASDMLGHAQERAAGA